jgi:aminopeptidase N
MNDAATSHQTSNVWKVDAAPAKYYPVPLDKPELFTYYTDVYGPGPMVLFRQLEVMTSRAQVLAAIKSVIGSPHALSVDDLLAALARETGLDLTQYAQAWIKGSGVPNWPQLVLTYTPGSLQIHQQNPNPTPQGCKFHVVLRGANAGEAASVAVDTFAGGPDQTLAVTTPAFTVTAIDLDPDHECLVFKYSSSPRIAPAVQPWVSPRFSSRSDR